MKIPVFQVRILDEAANVVASFFTQAHINVSERMAILMGGSEFPDYLTSKALPLTGVTGTRIGDAIRAFRTNPPALHVVGKPMSPGLMASTLDAWADVASAEAQGRPSLYSDNAALCRYAAECIREVELRRAAAKELPAVGLTNDEAQAIEKELSTFGEIYTSKGKLHLSNFEGKTLRDLARDIVKQNKESSS